MIRQVGLSCFKGLVLQNPPPLIGVVMHVRNTKTVTEGKLRISLRMYVDEVSLELDTDRCLKCDICAAVCPRDSVSICNLGDRLTIDIDEKTCVLCEVCSQFCPNGSIVLRQNGTIKNSLLENEGLPQFPVPVEIDLSRCPQACECSEETGSHWCRQQKKLVENPVTDCPKSCRLCVDVCSVEVLTKEAGTLRADVERCLRCIRCLDECELGAISVNPLLTGEIRLEDAKCPEDCTKCIDLCPTRAIHREGKRVFVEDRYCIFCGVCTNICDKEAITLRRRGISVTGEGASAAWTDALGKLLGEVDESDRHCPVGMVKPTVQRQDGP
jgi:4Fe-4S ferredoxin